MEKEFIRYEEALALKKIMISVECMAYYYDNVLKIWQNGLRNCKNIDFIAVFNDEKLCAAPLYQQAFKFFREKHSICGWVQESYFKGVKLYQYTISKSSTLNLVGSITESYEEAQLECLKKLIEINNL